MTPLDFQWNIIAGRTETRRSYARLRRSHARRKRPPPFLRRPTHINTPPMSPACPTGWQSDAPLTAIAELLPSHRHPPAFPSITGDCRNHHHNPAIAGVTPGSWQGPRSDGNHGGRRFFAASPAIAKKIWKNRQWVKKSLVTGGCRFLPRFSTFVHQC